MRIAYVKLLNEGVDVWRPVTVSERGAGLYEINDQTYDRSMEQWEFEPNAVVRCEWKQLAEGDDPVLVVVGLK